MLSLGKIPFRNIKTHTVRTLILMIVTAAQAICVLGGILIMRGIWQETTSAKSRLGADVLVYPEEAFNEIDQTQVLSLGTPAEIYSDRSALSKMDYCDGIESAACQIYLKDTSASGDDLWIVAYDPETDFVIAPWLGSEEPGALPEGNVIAGSKAAVSPDGTITVFGRRWPVGAQLKESRSFMDTAVFVPLDLLPEVTEAGMESGNEACADLHPESDFSVVLVRVTDPDQAEGVTSWINLYVPGTMAVEAEEMVTRTSAGLEGASGTVAVIIVLVWIVLLTALGIIQSILMKERVKELFVWHCIGASQSVVNRVMLTEALIVHFMGAAAGALAAGIILGLGGDGLLPGGSPGLLPVFLCALASVLITAAVGVLSSWIALRRASEKLSAQMLLME